tara:strand:- start:6438 stop:7424 length:987 start_codon:yes stop_codon:yes gene_type:complete
MIIYGSWYDGAMIVLQCNDAYFNWLKLLLESLTAQGIGIPLFVSIYNGTNDMAAQCQLLYPNCTVELDMINTYGLPMDQFSLRDCMTNRKVFVLSDVVDRLDPDWVLLLDVDTICRQPFTHWIDQLLIDGIDVAVVKNLHDDPVRKYSSSTVFISRKAYPFVYQWEWFVSQWEVVGERAFEFGWDQLSLNFTIHAFFDVKYSFLKRRYFVDDGFHADAYFWTWGTPVQSMKSTVYEFFNEHKLGNSLTLAAAENYMNQFFNLKEYRAAFPFAHQIVMQDPSNCHAMFVLGTVYMMALNNYSMAKQIFLALQDASYRVDDCQDYLDAMK